MVIQSRSLASSDLNTCCSFSNSGSTTSVITDSVGAGKTEDVAFQVLLAVVVRALSLGTWIICRLRLKSRSSALGYRPFW
jgi:hypothetical protein